MKLSKNTLVILSAAILIAACKEEGKKPAAMDPEAPASEVTSGRAEAPSTSFKKTLELQGFSFEVETRGEGSLRELTVTPSGLQVSNDPIVMEIDGSVGNAEIEDLNSDGFPELLVYTTSAGSGSYGTVIGFSVLNGKSLSEIYFPDISGVSEAATGYMGHDEFAIVENTLVRRFPIYLEGDPNSSPSGGIRQVEYKLEAGENSPVLAISNITDL